MTRFFKDISLLMCVSSCTSLGIRSIDNRGQKGDSSLPKPDNSPVLQPDANAPGDGSQDGATENVTSLLLAEKDSAPVFQVTYSYAGSLKYTVKYQTTLKDEETAKLPAQIKYSFYQGDSASFISGWLDTPKSSVQQLELTVTDQKVLRQLIPFQSKVDIIFSVPNDKGKDIPRYALAIGGFCNQLEAKYFNNETDPTKSCFDVTEADVKAKAPDAFQ